MCLKVDLALDQEVLLAKKFTNSINLRGHYDFIKNDLTLPLLPHPILPRFFMPYVPSVSSLGYRYIFLHWPYDFLFMRFPVNELGF